MYDNHLRDTLGFHLIPTIFFLLVAGHYCLGDTVTIQDNQGNKVTNKTVFNSTSASGQMFAYVAFNQANQSKQLILGPQDEAYFDPKEFDTNKRLAWHYEEVNSKINYSNSLNQINYSFKF